jgi:hypothetical protein
MWSKQHNGKVRIFRATCLSHLHMDVAEAPLCNLSLLLEVFYTPSLDSICRHVQRQLRRNELARFYHCCTHTCVPSQKLRRDIQ